MILFTPRDSDGDWQVAHVDPTGKTEWVDYIPVQEVTEVAASKDRYEEDGHIPIKIVAESGIAWTDYIPIDIVTGRTGRWRFEADGFIPVVDNTPI